MIRITGLAVVVALAAFSGAGQAETSADRASEMIQSAAWDEIKGDVLGDRVPLDGSGIFALEAPFRAEDAAIVPIHILQTEGTPVIRKLTLIVDENPSPVVGVFTFGPAIGEVDLETRIRINAYSNVRAIAETEDGKLYMTGRYVRAAGGCSAPASKDAAAALAALGQMKARWYDNQPVQSVARREAQVMLRHPNYSGLQRNQVTNLYVPARFVDRLEVNQGDEVLFTMEGGISISEDPTFRFRYTDQGKGEPLVVKAHDTDNRMFEASFPLGS